MSVKSVSLSRREAMKQLLYIFIYLYIYIYIYTTDSRLVCAAPFLDAKKCPGVPRESAVFAEFIEFIYCYCGSTRPPGPIFQLLYSSLREQVNNRRFRGRERQEREYKYIYVYMHYKKEGVSKGVTGERGKKKEMTSVIISWTNRVLAFN